jgi:hypothetical protein
MRKLFVALFCAALLSGCGTMAFTPKEYPLRAGLVPTLDVHGTVTASNAQPSTDAFIVYSYSGSKLGSNLHDITQVMVQQTNEELQKNGHQVSSGSPKSIAIKVDSLVSRYSNAFYWKSTITFQATLGDGEVIEMDVHHASGILAQDLNGCIAEGVMTLLNDKRVKTYLSS